MLDAAATNAPWTSKNGKRVEEASGHRMAGSSDPAGAGRLRSACVRTGATLADYDPSALARRISVTARATRAAYVWLGESARKAVWRYLAERPGCQNRITRCFATRSKWPHGSGWTAAHDRALRQACRRRRRQRPSLPAHVCDLVSAQWRYGARYSGLLGHERMETLCASMPNWQSLTWKAVSATPARRMVASASSHQLQKMKPIEKLSQIALYFLERTSVLLGDIHCQATRLGLASTTQQT